MLPARIIAQKRDGCELSDQQIAEFIRGYATDDIPDYQMAAFAMAVFLNGMTETETAALTQAMLDSGDCLRWPNDGFLRVDKHSTGGVGDKISIPLAPLLASCGLQVPMLSGRGLGPTGGTLDKLESISGFRSNLSLDEIARMTQQNGCVITSACVELAPADRRLYALRDVTATVSSVPLITASIMSKKLAESPDALVLDVKFGSGAFMKTRQQAGRLARSLVSTGYRMGVPATALITNMNQPLGRMCGNAVEIEESLQILRGEGPADVRELTLRLAGELLTMTGLCETENEATARAQSQLDSGHALENFQRMVTAQGGDLTVTRRAAPAADVIAERAGTVAEIDVEGIGYAIIAMGGGRCTMNDPIDHSVGVEMLVQVGDQIDRGQPLMRQLSHDPEQHDDALRRCISLADTAEHLPLIVDRLSGDDL